MCTSLNNLPKTITWNWCSYGGFLLWRWHSQPFNGRLLGNSCVWAFGLSHQQTLSTPTFYRLAALVYGYSAQIKEGEIECPEKDGNGQSIADVSHPKGRIKSSEQGKCWLTMSSWFYDTFSWRLNNAAQNNPTSPGAPPAFSPWFESTRGRLTLIQQEPLKSSITSLQHSGHTRIQCWLQERLLGVNMKVLVSEGMRTNERFWWQLFF